MNDNRAENEQDPTDKISEHKSAVVSVPERGLKSGVDRRMRTGFYDRADVLRELADRIARLLELD
jgi:hypothetical protein